mgnify:CR=1 FL=1
MSFHSILFLDIETVPQHPDYEQLPAEWKDLWDKKSASLMRHQEEASASDLYARAGIYAEFGKIICVCMGYITGKSADKKLILRTVYGENEKEILQECATLLEKWGQEEQHQLCAHNGKEFDYPYLARRMIIHQLPLPRLLNNAGKKPWQVPLLDTLELWKFGDYKSFTSLNLLAHTLGIPTPKDDIDGSQVGEVYWKEKNLPRIAAYCEKDVLTVAQVYLRITGESLIPPENIELR